ncbi:hypothetical protein SEA_KEITABEAR_58 [Gordonia phage Keitabear]|uniref:Uncharacterized protein n=1 Tax=Gordonia phage Keitabear TaxID=2653274 RepID=A0A5P8D8T0_9CAUD|nr:hypothetical protein KNU77_gp58 [Gordonia phage Keitabear]QFP94500.1 hypothetical protein SEA_KEITABEAR_58 [Gordonia phage Keitabear]
MTDHRTTAENDLARAVHAVADALAKYARDCPARDCPAPDCPAPDCLLAAGHTGDHDTTDLPDHAVLQQHADRARAAFPGTYSPPQTYHHVLHTSEGGDTSALAADVPDGSHEHGRAPAPASCGHTWKGRNTLVDCRGAHTCAQPDTHPDGRHVCTSCGQTTPAVDVCGYPGANGVCQRERGHSGVHYDEHGGVFATGSDVVDNRSQLDKLADWIIANVDGEPSQSEGAGDTAIRIIDGLQATVSGQRVLMDSYERQIRALAQQNGQLRDQRDRESELRLAAQQAAVDPDLHQKLRRIDNVLRGALNAERTPSTLPFIDLVTDLGYQADAVVDDLTSERESRATVFETAKTLSQAIVHTVEYVGNDMLPAVEGWSWYDALRHFHPDAANRFLTNPVRPKAQQ